MNKVVIVFSLFAILFFGTFSSATAAVNSHANENSDRSSIFIPDRYIVVLEDDFAPQDVAKGHGVSPMFVYKKALNGFAATIPPPLLEKIQKDSRVKYVEQDKIAEITSQVLPNGMDRINLDTNAIVTIDGQDDGLGLALIAIIDTGVDRQHSDLNVHATLGIECSAFFNIAMCNEGGAYGDDDNGHGTHVAGVAAALDNGIGVVGVAPGATIVPVKVLDANGGGSLATVIAGVEYVTLHAGQIDVANMSLRVLAVSPSLNAAVAASVDAGVVYVVAAGNDVLDASTVSPASEAKAITVSAIADFDGMSGALDNQTRTWSIPGNPNVDDCTEMTDDSFVCFSNFGDIVDIAAPGVGILSTVPIGTSADCMFCTPDGLRLADGTSSAAPHVAGAAALIRSQDFSMSTTQVENALMAMAAPKISADGYTLDPNDPQNEDEPMLMVGYSPPPTSNNPPTVETPIVDVNEDEDAANTEINLTAHFDDIEDEASDLTYSVFANDNAALVGTSIAGVTLTLSYTADISGTANITIRATDSGSLTIDDTFIVTVNPVNDAPSVTINSPSDGSSFTEGDSVTFSSTSSDPEDGSLSGSIDWSSSIDGVLGTGSSVSTSTLSVGTHTITASVTDSESISDSDTISITIDPAPIQNDPPIADAGPDQGVYEGDDVILDGSGSTDDGTIAYAWTQTAGPSVTLSGADTVNPSFTAPEVKGKKAKVLQFQLTVTDDDGASSTNTVNITVSNAPATNNPPTAVNDADSVNQGTTVTINVVANDSDDGTLDLSSIAIKQAPSNAASLVDNSDGTLTYTHDGSATISDSFKYTINDNGGATSNEATVSITVTQPTQDIKVHVGVLDGTLTTKGPWNTFSVTITIHDDSTPTHALQSNVIVSGLWSDELGSETCTTNGNGECSVSLRSKSVSSVVFTVDSLGEDGFENDLGSSEVTSVSIPMP